MPGTDYGVLIRELRGADTRKPCSWFLTPFPFPHISISHFYRNPHTSEPLMGWLGERRRIKVWCKSRGRHALYSVSQKGDKGKEPRKRKGSKRRLGLRRGIVQHAVVPIRLLGAD
jgi:hypothetical protein